MSEETIEKVFEKWHTRMLNERHFLRSTYDVEVKAKDFIAFKATIEMWEAEKLVAPTREAELVEAIKETALYMTRKNLDAVGPDEIEEIKKTLATPTPPSSREKS